MNIIIPLGGLGNRFKQEGYRREKIMDDKQEIKRELKNLELDKFFMEMGDRFDTANPLEAIMLGNFVCWKILKRLENIEKLLELAEIINATELIERSYNKGRDFRKVTGDFGEICLVHVFDLIWEILTGLYRIR